MWMLTIHKSLDEESCGEFDEGISADEQPEVDADNSISLQCDEEIHGDGIQYFVGAGPAGAEP